MATISRDYMITQYLKDKDPSLIELPEPTNSNYTMFNDGGVETAVGEFLYGLVRMMKPEYVFETGTHHGISSSYMGLALKDNGKGLLTTVEIDKDCIKISKEQWSRLGVEKYICVDKDYSLEYDVEYDCDLMFLDSEPYYRFQELRRFFPRLKPGGYAFIHDAPRNLCQGNFNPDHPEFKSWPFGDINQDVKNWVLDHDLMPFHFGTPRGLVGFYKRHPSDYCWDRNGDSK